MRRSFERGTYLTLAAAVLLICVPVQARMTVAQKKQIAHKQFQTAEKMREALNGRAQSDRTRTAYSRVVEAYRKVYRLAPSGRDAAPSLLAMGEVMAESGRVLNDPTQSQAAIEQFKSIPNEYPGSHERVDALFRRVLGRHATKNESASALRFIAEAKNDTDPANGLNDWEQLAQVLLISNEAIFFE